MQSQQTNTAPTEQATFTAAADLAAAVAPAKEECATICEKLQLLYVEQIEKVRLANSQLRLAAMTIRL